MLITSFKNGELSENLFGRTDVPQYYSGAARIENFNVVPAGGIKKRSGTKRLAPLDASGRLIPVIISKDEMYMLLLANGKISVYRAGEWETPMKVFEKTEGDSRAHRNLYTDEEIHDVQYAQNQRLLVLVHQNHPPFMMEFYPDFINLDVFFINTIISQGHEPGVNNFYTERDRNFDGDLKTEGQYPRTVAFFNGRLVFGGTKRFPQRFYFSHVNRFWDFSTYKAFITEPKNYFTVRGSIFNGQARIVMEDTRMGRLDGGDIIKDPWEYFIDAPNFFPVGTTLKSIPYTINENGRDLLVIETSEKAGNTIEQFPPDILDELSRRVDAFNNRNTHYKEGINPGKYNNENYLPSLFEYIWDFQYRVRGTVGTMTAGRIDIWLGADRYYLKGSRNGTSREVILPHDILSHPNPRQWIIDDITDKARSIAIQESGGSGGSGDHTRTPIKNSIGDVVDAWLSIILERMMSFTFTFEDKTTTLHDRMPNIQGKVSGLQRENLVNIPIYTIDQVRDDHPTPDCGFFMEIASGANDAIKWMTVNRGILAGTEMAEWLIPSGVNPGQTAAIALSSHGSDDIPGVKIGDTVCFFSAGKRGLVEYYPNENDHFRANNMAMFAAQMLSESPAVGFDYTTSPFTKLYITRADGTIVTLLYERNTGTFAWGRIKTRGKIKSAAVLPGSGESNGSDDVYLLVERDGNYYLEALQEDSKVYLDGYTQVTAQNWDEVRSLYGGENVRVSRRYMGKPEKQKAAPAAARAPAQAKPLQAVKGKELPPGAEKIDRLLQEYPYDVFMDKSDREKEEIYLKYNLLPDNYFQLEGIYWAEQLGLEKNERNSAQIQVIKYANSRVCQFMRNVVRPAELVKAAQLAEKEQIIPENPAEVKVKAVECYETLNAEDWPNFSKGGDYYIGYTYPSTLRTMPVLANSTLKKHRIVNILFRFLNSYLPKLRHIGNGKIGRLERLTGEAPFSGVKKELYPGGWEEDVQAEIISEDPVPVNILALNADMDGAGK